MWEVSGEVKVTKELSILFWKMVSYKNDLISDFEKHEFLEVNVTVNMMVIFYITGRNTSYMLLEIKTSFWIYV